MAQKEYNPVAIGITYVKKAHMWEFYKTFNQEHAQDVHEFFGTEDEAKARLVKEQNAA
jgi:hypothetical protein